MAKKQITACVQVYMESKMKQSLDELFGKHGLIPMKTSQFIRDAVQDWMSQLEKALEILKGTTILEKDHLIDHLTSENIKYGIAEYAAEIFIAQKDRSF